MDLLFEVLSNVHTDLSKSGQLVPKLKEGLEEWIAANALPGGMDTQKIGSDRPPSERTMQFRHVSRDV